MTLTNQQCVCVYVSEQGRGLLLADLNVNKVADEHTQPAHSYLQQLLCIHNAPKCTRMEGNGLPGNTHRRNGLYAGAYMYSGLLLPPTAPSGLYLMMSMSPDDDTSVVGRLVMWLGAAIISDTARSLSLLLDLLLGL